MLFSYAYYLSFKFVGEIPESQFQPVIKWNKFSLKDKTNADIQEIMARISPDLENNFRDFVFTGITAACTDYLEFHFNMYKKARPGQEVNFLYFVGEQIQTISIDGQGGETFLPEPRIKTILAWIESKKIEIKQNVQPVQVMEKIKWTASPAILVFLIQEFVAKDFIEPPNYGGEPSMSGLAKLCYECFDVKASPEYFERAMRNPEALVNAKKQKFTIPKSSDLA